MINKITGYGGFRSYNQQPYPTEKQGKQLQKHNQIWSSTRRQVDKINPLDNHNHFHTIYKKSYLQNTLPINYHPEHVKRGAHSSIDFNKGSSTLPYDKQEALNNNGIAQNNSKNGYNLLKTGTQHWKSCYQGTHGQAQNFNKTLNPSSKIQNGNQSSLNTNVNQRSQSTGKNLSKLQAQYELSKALSYKNRPYINDAKTGTTQYKFNYGQNIGTAPTDLLGRQNVKQPLRNNPLKLGTNQLWTQIPNYQGFKPSGLHFDQLKAKIQQRNSVQKGNSKINLTQNYHVNIPGYAGFVPKYSNNDSKLRSSCFQYKPK